MSIPSIAGVSSTLNIYKRTRQNVYGEEEYVVDSHKKDAQIQKLQLQKKNQTISPGKFEIMMKEIEAAPKIVHTNKSGSVVKSPLKSQEEDKNILGKLASVFSPAAPKQPEINTESTASANSTVGSRLDILA